jgi:hypothetical protein
MTELPRAEYERRLSEWRARIALLDRRHLFYSNVRLILAVVGAVLLWQAFVRARISPWWPVTDLVLFAVVAVAHALLLQRAERSKRAEAVYRRGIDRLADRWAGAGRDTARDGTRFLEGHPYARDLDLFGRASLFERLNTSRTEAGEVTLAEWIRAGASADEVRARQAAVDELRPRLDFREDVAVLASESPVGRTGALAMWAASPPANFPDVLRFGFAAAAAVTVVLTWLTYREVIWSGWFVFWVLFETALAGIWRHAIHHVLHAIETPERDLGLLSALLARIEREPFASPRLTGLRDTLLAGGVPPSRRIARLRSLVSWADSTHNLLFGPIAHVLLVKPQVAVAIDRWQRANGPAIGEWLRVVGDVEALSALATYAYERPADPFPDLVDAGPLFDGDAVAHPLIPDAVSVPNDVHLGANHSHVIVVSGSNMSGKSTLLRTVGVNVVLALAGAPVRAARLRVSPLVLGATLRIEDSLQEGHSRFYNEILRLHHIVQDARGPVPLLFLLDEILHGTNSHDRRIGAEAVVRGLVERGAIGLVTTHDLALTELPSRLDGAVNMHFEDRLENGRMVFDYRIRQGVVEHSNAIALMRAIGLDV